MSQSAIDLKRNFSYNKNNSEIKVSGIRNLHKTTEENSQPPPAQAKAVYIQRLGDEQEPIINIQIQETKTEQKTKPLESMRHSQMSQLSQNSGSMTHLLKSKDFKSDSNDLYAQISQQAKFYKQFGHQQINLDKINIDNVNTIEDNISPSSTLQKN